jgi:hypothetical protein
MYVLYCIAQCNLKAPDRRDGGDGWLGEDFLQAGSPNPFDYIALRFGGRRWQSAKEEKMYTPQSARTRAACVHIHTVRLTEGAKAHTETERERGRGRGEGERERERERERGARFNRKAAVHLMGKKAVFTKVRKAISVSTRSHESSHPVARNHTSCCRQAIP